MIRSLAIFAFVAAPVWAAELPKDKQWIELQGSSTDKIAAKIEVVDDPMNTAITVSSAPVYQLKAAPSFSKGDAGENDNYLKALVDRKTGSVTYWFIFTSRYQGQYQKIRSANYMTDQGAVAADVVESQSDMGPCSKYGCIFSVFTAVEVPRATLDWAQTLDGSDINHLWQVRLFSDREKGDRFIHPKEIAGFLAKVDATAAGKGF